MSSHFKLVFDIDDGTTTQGMKQSTELVIFVTPVITPAKHHTTDRVMSCEESFETARLVM